MKYDIFKTIESYCNKTAIKFEEKLITYDELLSNVKYLENKFFELGVGSHSHVAIKISNSLSYLYILLALWKINATIVPIDLQVSENNLQELLQQADVTFLITDQKNLCTKDFLEKNPTLYGIVTYTNKTIDFINKSNFGNVKTWIQQQNLPSKDGYIILFTSGTSGKSKGVLIKKDSFLNNLKKVIEYTGLTDKDSILLTLPLTYCFALSQLLSHLIVGGKVIIYDGIKNPIDIILKIQENKVTNFSATPYFYETIVKENENINFKFTNLKFFMNAGGYISKQTIIKILTLFSGIMFFNNYGQTEASPRLTYNKISGVNCDISSVGKPLKGVTIKIEKYSEENIGEIIYNSVDMMLGYYKNKIIPRDEFIHSGDLGFLDESGNLTIVGRKDSMIKINGRKVYKNKIEDELNSLPFVKMIKLKKEIHQRFGEYFAAYIVPFENYQKNDLINKLQSYCKVHFDKYISPKKFIIVENIKLNSNQKIILEESKK